MTSVIGVKSSTFLTPKSREYAEGYVLPMIFSTGRCENIEYQVVCNSGDIIDVLVSSVVDWNAIGGPATLSIVTDITAQKPPNAS